MMIRIYISVSAIVSCYPLSWCQRARAISWRNFGLVVLLGDTDDTSIYRDTKISRYWYRACLDTFWYRDTKSIAILFDTFCRYCT